MTNYEIQKALIINTFSLALSSEKELTIHTDEWELVCILAFENGADVQGRIYDPHGFGSWDNCNVNDYGCPEAITINGSTVYFRYF